MAKIESKKAQPKKTKKVKKKKQSIVKKDFLDKNSFDEKMIEMLSEDPQGGFLVDTILRATKNDNDFAVFSTQLFSNGNIIRLLHAYLFTGQPVSAKGFCRKFKIPLKYLKRLRNDNPSESLIYLLDLLESEDEIRYLDKIENAKSTASVVGGAFLLKTRHGYNEGGAAGGSGGGGNANVIVNFTPTNSDLIKEINANGKAPMNYIDNGGDKDDTQGE